jgi:DNA repair protein RadC
LFKEGQVGKKTAGQGITQWPETERPRERLLAQGADALTDAQLLAILLRVGRRRSSAVQVGIEILDHLGGVAGLARCGIDELCAVPLSILVKSSQWRSRNPPQP